MKPLSECHLYTFVDTTYLHGRTPQEVARELCDGGSDLIQLRAKTSARDEIRRMAEAILPITRQGNVGLVINDHPDIASEVGAELCHLGQEDFFDADGHQENPNSATGRHEVNERARGLSLSSFRGEGRGEEVGRSQALFGLSSHAPAQAQRAIAAGAAYIAIGPVYATGTKPSVKPVTLDYVRWAAADVRIPWFAIGGINLDNLDDVLKAGAKRICVVSAILNAN